MSLPPDKAKKLVNVDASIKSIYRALHMVETHVLFARRARKYQSFNCSYAISQIMTELAKIEENNYKQ